MRFRASIVMLRVRVTGIRVGVVMLGSVRFRSLDKPGHVWFGLRLENDESFLFGGLVDFSFGFWVIQSAK